MRELSRREGVTIFMLLLAVFKTLLHHYTGETDIPIGSLIANRNRWETEGLIGFFVNTLVLRTDLSGDPLFRDLLGRVRQTALAAYARQEFPFERLVEELQPERSLSRTPLFQVMFILQHAPLSAIEFEGLQLHNMRTERRTANFDLALLLTEGGEGITGSLEYRRDLWEEETIRRIARHYEKILAEVVRNAEQRIRDIELLSRSEREQILVKWNETRVETPRNKSITDLFEEQVEKSPEATAVAFKNQELTYEQLNARANQLARVLVEQGVGPEVLVALLAERGLDFLITMLAVLKAGGAYIPLDPQHPAPRIGKALGRSGTALVITTSQFGTLAAEAVANSETENPPALLFLEDLLNERRQVENLGRYLPPSQLVYVIFTSGSTGIPKGVMVEQGGMLNHLYEMVRDLLLDDKDVDCDNTR